MTDTTHRTRVGLFTCLQVDKTVSPPDWVLEADGYSVTTHRDMGDPTSTRYTYFRTAGGQRSLVRAGSWLVQDPILAAVFVVDDDCFQSFFEAV